MLLERVGTVSNVEGLPGVTSYVRRALSRVAGERGVEWRNASPAGVDKGRCGPIGYGKRRHSERHRREAGRLLRAAVEAVHGQGALMLVHSGAGQSVGIDERALRPVQRHSLVSSLLARAQGGMMRCRITPLQTA